MDREIGCVEVDGFRYVTVTRWKTMHTSGNPGKPIRPDRDVLWIFCANQRAVDRQTMHAKGNYLDGVNRFREATFPEAAKAAPDDVALYFDLGYKGLDEKILKSRHPQPADVDCRIELEGSSYLVRDLETRKVIDIGSNPKTVGRRLEEAYGILRDECPCGYDSSETRPNASTITAALLGMLTTIGAERVAGWMQDLGRQGKDVLTLGPDAFAPPHQVAGMRLINLGGSRIKSQVDFKSGVRIHGDRIVDLELPQTVATAISACDGEDAALDRIIDAPGAASATIREVVPTPVQGRWDIRFDSPSVVVDPPVGIAVETEDRLGELLEGHAATTGAALAMMVLPADVAQHALSELAETGSFDISPWLPGGLKAFLMIERPHGQQKSIILADTIMDARRIGGSALATILRDRA